MSAADVRERVAQAVSRASDEWERREPPMYDEYGPMVADAVLAVDAVDHWRRDSELLAQVREIVSATNYSANCIGVDRRRSETVGYRFIAALVGGEA